MPTRAARPGASPQLLGGLDGALRRVRERTRARWRETVVVAITEFGRTAHINGTIGTDHGTARSRSSPAARSTGGRVVADWPGLKTADLYEARDLKATTDLRAVLKGVLADHLGLSARSSGAGGVPGSLGVTPMSGLIAA